MSRVLELEKLSKTQVSLFFRLLIIAYSVFLILYKGTEIGWWWYLGGITLYCVCYFFLRMKDSIWSLFRLTGDYIFIAFVLYFVNGDLDILSFSLLLLPILNAPNHSGQGRSIFLYIYPVLIIYILENRIDVWVTIPFIIFMIINNFEYRRNRKHIFYENLNSLIDNYYIGSNSFQKPYQIFRDVVRLLNENKIFTQNVIGFYSFINKPTKPSVLYGSSFVGEYNIKNYKNIIKKNKSDESVKFVRNIEITLNQNRSNQNLLYMINLENKDSYSFLLCFDEKVSSSPFSFFRLYTFKKVFDPFLHRLAKVLSGDYKNRCYKLENIKELEKHFEYIAKARDMMHYIKNNLSPLTTYLSIQQELKETSDPEKIKILENYASKSRDKLEASSKAMLNTAKNILEQSKNPYSFLDKNTFAVEHLYSEIRNIWNNYFDEDNIKSNIDFNLPKNYKLNYNEVGIVVLLDNLISNMYKYKKTYANIEISENVDFIYIKFINDATIERYSILESYLLEDKDEILKKRTHGMLHIKKTLEDMEIDYAIDYTEDNELILNMKLEKIHNENTYI
ncbi:hypothetical protein [Dysgonomonas capnocytophagoides]|uniref:hypothetical protein n=1 Tax=Dysgonomonas capnocytophagoides TaxID=45254 RepID=UPI0033418D7F